MHPDLDLTTAQQQVLSQLACGVTVAAAAEAAGVHRNTVSVWRRSSAIFREALETAQYEQAMHWRDQLQRLAPVAIACLNEILLNPKTPPSILLRAAQSVLKAVSTPAPRFVHNAAQSTANAHASESAAVAVEAAAPATMHNSAQRAPITLGRAASKHASRRVGRNSPCPCGSGRKHKLCCLAPSNHPSRAPQPATPQTSAA